MSRVIEDLKWFHKTLGIGGKTAEFYESQKDIILQALVVLEMCDEHYRQGRKDAINDFVSNAMTEFKKFDAEHGYPTLGDIEIILGDVAEGLNGQKNE